MTILSVLFMPYMNIPLLLNCPDGVTNIRKENNCYYVYSSEGYGYGRTNNEGYHNAMDYHDNSDIDILIMGSSHVEAEQMCQDDSVTGQLNHLLDEKYIAYNIGISGHTLPVCVKNLPFAVEKYSPDFVIIETADIIFNDDDVQAGLKHKIENHQKWYIDVIPGCILKNSYFQCIWLQLKNYINNNSGISKLNDDTTFYRVPDELIEEAGKIAADHGCECIIVYHPPVKLTDNGLYIDESEEAVTAFSNQCKRAGIEFINLKDAFLQKYEKNHVVPYGFANSHIAQGHLNKEGHRMMAEELYKSISERGFQE